MDYPARSMVWGTSTGGWTKAVGNLPLVWSQLTPRPRDVPDLQRQFICIDVIFIYVIIVTLSQAYQAIVSW